MNIGGFARRNWKFMVLVAVILSVVAVTLLAILPQQYSRQLTLGIRIVPVGLLGDFEQPTINPAEPGNSAVNLLREENIEGVTVLPTYNIVTQQVDVTLQSQSREALESASGARFEKLLEKRFRDVYQKLLVATLDAPLTDLRLQAQSEKEALALIEGEISGAQGARLQGLETERADALAEIKRLETEVERLERVQQDPSELETSLVVVSAVSETEVVQSRSFMPMAVLAVMLSLVAAVAAAIVRTTLTTKR